MSLMKARRLQHAAHMKRPPFCPQLWHSRRLMRVAKASTAVLTRRSMHMYLMREQVFLAQA